MLDKILKEMVVSLLGKDNEKIAELLNSNKYVNEFKLAEKLEITINQTRNLLYKLSNYDLVSSVRKKDKKKGWYTYSWHFKILKCLEFMKKKYLKKKEQTETQISRRKENQFYVCESCNLEHSEDKALLMNFTCDECGELLTLKDNTNLLKALEKNLKKIQKELEEIGIEITLEKKKFEKKKLAGLRKEKRELEKKKEEAKLRREEKRKARLLEKKKEEEAKPKKKITKKDSSKGKTKKTATKKTSKKPVKKKSATKKTTSTKKVKAKKSSSKKPKSISKPKGIKSVLSKISRKKK